MFVRKKREKKIYKNSLSCFQSPCEKRFPTGKFDMPVEKKECCYQKNEIENNGSINLTFVARQLAV